MVQEMVLLVAQGAVSLEGTVQMKKEVVQHLDSVGSTHLAFLVQ